MQKTMFQDLRNLEHGLMYGSATGEELANLGAVGIPKPPSCGCHETTGWCEETLRRGFRSGIRLGRKLLRQHSNW